MTSLEGINSALGNLGSAYQVSGCVFDPINTFLAFELVTYREVTILYLNSSCLQNMALEIHTHILIGIMKL